MEKWVIHLVIVLKWWALSLNKAVEDKPRYLGSKSKFMYSVYGNMELGKSQKMYKKVPSEIKLNVEWKEQLI